MITKTKVLITGGIGALGFNLTQKLKAQEEYGLHILDNLSSGIVNLSNDIEFSYMDIGNTEKINSFFTKYKPNLIFHLAAHFANQNSVDHPVSDAITNVIGIINLLESQKNNTSLQKVVYASSSCVYGNCEVMREDVSVTPYDTPYAINKYVGELYCKYYAEIHKIPLVCARIFNSYGPGEMPGQYRNVIPNFIKKALQNEDIVITGNGDETRDFTYVSDTVNLLIKLANSDYKNAEIFNGGTGVKISIRHLAELIIKLTGSDSKIIYTPRRNWDHVKDRQSNITKSQKLLHYHPNFDFEEGLINTIKWIKSKMK